MKRKKVAIATIEHNPKHGLFTNSQLQQIEQLQIPNPLRFMLAEKFDDKFLNTNLNKWEFYYAGKTNVIDMNELDEPTKKLMKYYLAYYVQVNSPSTLYNYYLDIKELLNTLIINKKSFSYDSFAEILTDIATNQQNQRKYFSIKFLLKILISNEFENFDETDEKDLLTLPRPDFFNANLYYQDIDDPINLATITMMQNGFAKINHDILNNLEIHKETLTNCSILGLAYATGMRPVQIAKLAVDDIKIDTINDDGEFMRFSVMVPYAKQGKFKHTKICVKLPEEIALIILKYINVLGLSRKDKLFELGKYSVKRCTSAVNKQLFNFSSPYYQEQVKKGEIIRHYYTMSDFRHHIGYEMAINGASAEDIAYILGHSTLVTARHYILSTPNLAQIRAQALGRNPLYQQMIAMLMTGDIIINNNDLIEGKNIVGFVNDKIHQCIGKCAYKNGCFLEPVRSCYSCVYFHPYLDGEHKEVLVSVQNELEQVIKISDKTYDSKNPLISIHENTKFEIESVIKRCELLGA